MHKENGLYCYSPSDLTRYMQSPFASWMDRYALEFPDIKLEKDSNDPLMEVLQQNGYAHEDALEALFREKKLLVTYIDGDSSADKLEKTLNAIRSGDDVIVQARLENGNFAGFADFLVRKNGASKLGDYYYEVWDTKLARTVKPTFAIQLCCYAEMLESIQGVIPENITIALGSGENESLKTSDFFHYYRMLKSSFLLAQASFNIETPLDPADYKNWGDWSEYATKQLTAKDHLFQVATITHGQIKKLNRVGIQTMQQLVDSPKTHTQGIHPAVFERLKAQAAIQKASIGKDKPEFKILPHSTEKRRGLSLLPPHSKRDVFFDIEGYPLDIGGLEYLWGCTYFDESGERSYKDFWAHDAIQEKQAFEAFIGWVYARWQADKTMHIYHYAAYEITACQKLMGRYGVCEYEVDQLLRNEVFIDLYKIVKGALLLGEPRYSIKNVEHLYREKREGVVTNGGDSIIFYEQWRDSHLRSEQDASKILEGIRTYNMDDCNSTQELADWLRQQQQDHKISYVETSTVPTVQDDVTQRITLRNKLLARAKQESETDNEKASLTENLAWVLEFHHREAKPVFWRMFDRKSQSPIELLDDLDCLALCARTNTPALQARAYAYKFPSQEFKDAHNEYHALSADDTSNEHTTVKYLKDYSNLKEGLIVLQATHEPPAIITLIPNEYVSPNPIPNAIDHVVAQYESGTLFNAQGRCAIIDFLRRVKPNIKGQKDGAIAPSHDPEQRLQQIIHVVTQLDHSYLAIQGPPGTGKSYTAKRIIAELVKHGVRVGISSNSHKAINHLLLSTAKYCCKQKISATFACTSNTEPDLATFSVSIVKNNQLAGHVRPRCVLGTTAWGFARDDMQNTLDYLFIDEAGQVSIANLIAMSRSAKNLVLIGDQMQLGQPLQGSHPAESGLSILDYLLHDSPTIADDMGVLLDTTYRMHSSVNQFISTHFYEGKVKADADNDKRTVKVPHNYQGLLNKDAGIIFIPVAHEGNKQSSDEEVSVIQAITKELLGRELTQLSGVSRPVSWSDILFVAPYNHQVSKLKQALGEQAKVGSVDKFQGQEAAIVILSMCTSDVNESPRGLDFLFDKNRLNVAISRAQCLAIVVANPNIRNTLVSRIDQLKRVNLFDALTE